MPDNALCQITQSRQQCVFSCHVEDLLCYQMCTVWNSLPDDIISSASFVTFCLLKSLFTVLFSDLLLWPFSSVVTGP